ncbi:hypothetical protein QP168_04865 [Aerococcus urinae]|uniref:LXG domain-containing protein n=1 Tax=Aerococcus mictus TaxID=2976810 RepID=A0A1E9PLI5_9LACT|nr:MULTISPECIES: hypothetical protein [Aerococcus]KAA9290417.1 hypothetical protein F6I06_08805 [Aerococcus mictus]MBU5610185.1 hypothetical protein [Aerococcus urinae]MCY3034905.1 hypothetical protein [Aerococcus mictus]MCY3063359.1 hypothetical protein [Aerococcus mictus]MCY3066033.1 hypothetical protein [Aerococcus mictus]
MKARKLINQVENVYNDLSPIRSAINEAEDYLNKVNSAKSDKTMLTSLASLARHYQDLLYLADNSLFRVLSDFEDLFNGYYHDDQGALNKYGDQDGE